MYQRASEIQCLPKNSPVFLYPSHVISLVRNQRTILPHCWTHCMRITILDKCIPKGYWTREKRRSMGKNDLYLYVAQQSLHLVCAHKHAYIIARIIDSFTHRDTHAIENGLKFENSIQFHSNQCAKKKIKTQNQIPTHSIQLNLFIAMK